jgi:hypothetical protein
MKSFPFLFIFVSLAILIHSCGKDNKENDPQLVGTWNVVKVEGQQYFNSSPGIYLADNNPTGYIKFEADGKGEQNYSFTLFGTNYPQNSSFRWYSSATTINIKRINDSDLVWNRVLSQENKQVASYDIPVDASTTIRYTLTLDK